MKKPITESQRKARQENARKMSKLPKTEAQIAASRENIKKAQAAPISAKKLEAVKRNQKLAYINLTQKQKNALEAGRRLGTAAVVEKQAWRKGVEVSNSPEGRQDKRERIIALRKTGLKETGIEKKVRAILSEIDVEFRQEYHFDGIGCVDFFLPSLNYVLECDGEYWHNLPGVREKDAKRDYALSCLGIGIARFTDREIDKRSEFVRAAILDITNGKTTIQADGGVQPAPVADSAVA